MLQGPLARKSCFMSPSTQCWSFEQSITAEFRPLQFNVAVVHGLLRIVGKVCGCCVLVKNQ